MPLDEHPAPAAHPAFGAHALRGRSLSEADSDAAPFSAELGPEAPLEVAATAYLAAKRHLALSTRKKYRAVLAPFVRHAGPASPVGALSASDISAWLDSTSANAQSRAVYCAHLGYFFRWLRGQGAVREDISKAVPLARVPTSAPKVLTAAHVERFAEAVEAYAARHAAHEAARHLASGGHPPGGDYAYLAQIMRANVCLGLRRGELIHLRWDAVDLARRTLRVANTAEFTTKTARERTIPLAGEALGVLGALPHRTGYVFRSRGAKLNPNTLMAAWRRFRSVAGLPPWATVHATRHTCLTRLAERGVPAAVIQKLAGHASLKTTERYLHVRPQAARHFVEQAFGRPGPSYDEVDYDDVEYGGGPGGGARRSGAARPCRSDPGEGDPRPDRP